MLKADIVARLEALGIEHDPGALKADLEALLPTEQSFEPADAGPNTRPVWEPGEKRQAYLARREEWRLSREPF